jgi:hypothetical protein
MRDIRYGTPPPLAKNILLTNPGPILTYGYQIDRINVLRQIVKVCRLILITLVKKTVIKEGYSA